MPLREINRDLDCVIASKADGKNIRHRDPEEWGANRRGAVSGGLISQPALPQRQLSLCQWVLVSKSPAALTALRNQLFGFSLGEFLGMVQRVKGNPGNCIDILPGDAQLHPLLDEGQELI